MDHLSKAAVEDFLHTVIILRVVYLDPQKLSQSSNDALMDLNVEDTLTEDFFRKLGWMVLEYERRGWLIR